MIACEKCGSPRMLLVATDQHMQVFRCQNCGEEILSRFYPKEKVFDEPRIRVLIEFNESPGIQSVATIKKLIANASDLSILEIKRRLESSRTWNAGIYSRHAAEQLREKGEQYGLVVNFEEVVE